MQFSKFGEKFTGNSGILSLMDDLGRALAASGENTVMMGGGNPAHIPEVEQILQQRMLEIAQDPALLRRLIGIYDPPQGESEFIVELAKMLKQQFGWQVGPENIALTNGSQSAFFVLFNLFGGQFSDGSFKQIQFPLAPEYIGYADTGLDHEIFKSTLPEIEMLEAPFYKYHVDFNRLHIGENTGAICVSRPTNPTGNVITDEELAHLDQLARDNDIPLILDNAYGLPFPGLIYTDAKPFWNDNTILCLSLSKLGLPATRTGIVVAKPEVIKAISSVTAIQNLSPSSLGSLLTLEMVKNGQLMNLCQDVIRPWYQKHAQFAVSTFIENMAKAGDYPYKIHKPEGAMFLWLWFPDLPISSLELYNRLKAREVLVVSGHYFFPGLTGEVEDKWQHRDECIRINYARDENELKRGLAIIAEEIAKAWQEK
ncbi:valine--pyruvate transaminase [Pelagibaculum spongiae]|uniref:Valine--pyruvate transaminase n=1 Tax=Pelagibaculum spongiae TaxID=2080658 RepID=A0A2V1GUE4_9GAMM|nr:valine--pyruvate transaminase [Pelagibaculum spongiae]PVZ69706.1 valine--pyruvate transaminase [Pelagibaculum spongiae]